MERGSLFEQALADLRAGRPEEAARRLKDHLWRDPYDADAYCALGLALAELGDPEGAVAALERAHYLRPEDPAVLVQYGLALQRAGRASEARLRFEAALRLEARSEETRRLEAPPDAAGPPAAGGADLDARWQAALFEALHRSVAAPAPRRPIPGPEPHRATTPPAPLPGTDSAPGCGPPPAGTPPAEARAETPALRPVPAASWPTGAQPGSGPVEDRPPLPEGIPLDAQPVPSFSLLVRGTVQLWAELPLLWLGGFAAANGAVTGLIPLESGPGDPGRTHAALLWTCAFALGAVPVLAAMAGLWVEGSAAAGLRALSPVRVARLLTLCTPLALLTTGAVAATLARRTPFPPEVLVPAALLFTLPFHGLLAPALMLAAREDVSAWTALGAALRVASRRTWMHLGVMLTVGTLLGGGLGVLGWAFAVSLHGAGEPVRHLFRVAGLALAESVWAAMVAVCGLDALAAARARQAAAATPYPAENAPTGTEEFQRSRPNPLQPVDGADGRTDRNGEEAG